MPRCSGWKPDRLRKEAYANALQDMVKRFLTWSRSINADFSTNDRDKIKAGQMLLTGFITPPAKLTIAQSWARTQVIRSLGLRSKHIGALVG